MDNYEMVEMELEVDMEGFEEGHNRLVLVGKNGKKEAARLHVIAAPEVGYYKIEYFLIRDWKERWLYSLPFIQVVTEEVAEMGGKELCVYPCAETYEDESTVPVSEWYKFFQTLGFRFADEGDEGNRPCRKMVLKIA